jgi:hypothetical protein
MARSDTPQNVNTLRLVSRKLVRTSSSDFLSSCKSKPRCILQLWRPSSKA